MPGESFRDLADPDLIKPGDIVWLESAHLTPTRGSGEHTWPHDAICLYHYYNDQIPDLIVSKTVFQFVCISSITRKNPFESGRQVLLATAIRTLGSVGFRPRASTSRQVWKYRLKGSGTFCRAYVALPSRWFGAYLPRPPWRQSWRYSTNSGRSEPNDANSGSERPKVWPICPIT